MWVAQLVETIFKVVAAKTDEKIIEEPTYPKYKIGGCIASAGSWSIGFNPSPSDGTGKRMSNGLEVFKTNIKKPITIIWWNITV